MLMRQRERSYRKVLYSPDLYLHVLSVL
jgi:hypothetical protein